MFLVPEDPTGCGPTGLKAALEGAGRGLRVALIEPKVGMGQNLLLA